MKKYRHTVQYYEIDRMGIVHHSNYIRWMEEARIDFLKQIGWGYEKLEACGAISPVTSVECKFKQSTTFPDEVFIEVHVEAVNGVRLQLRYVMEKEDGKTVCLAKSEHCFMDTDGKLIRLNSRFPELYQVLRELANEEKGGAEADPARGRRAARRILVKGDCERLYMESCLTRSVINSIVLVVTNRTTAAVMPQFLIW